MPGRPGTRSAPAALEGISHKSQLRTSVLAIEHDAAHSAPPLHLVGGTRALNMSAHSCTQGAAAGWLADAAHLGGLFKDDAGVGQVAVPVVELCEGAPQRVRLADGLRSHVSWNENSNPYCKLLVV